MTGDATGPAADSDAEPVDVTGLRIRQAVRALLVTPDAALLLCRFEFPTGTVWALPGGGLEDGESHRAALDRELDEEIGLRPGDVDVGPVVWRRRHIVPFVDGRWDGQDDVYHHVPVADRFDPRPRLDWEQLRAERLHELRWWSADEIERATIDGVRFAPQRLGDLLRRLHSEGPPPEPIDTGI